MDIPTKTPRSPLANLGRTWVKSHPELDKAKVGRFEDEDYGICVDKVTGKESLNPSHDGLSAH